MNRADVGQVSGVQAILTAGCNLRCGYCYQNAKDEQRRMEWDTLQASIDLLLRSERPKLTLTFYGGEPLLRFDLIERAVAYLTSQGRSGRRVRYCVITNGTLIDEERTRFLARHAFRTRISFDGVPAAQRFRGGGTWELLDALLDRIRTEHHRFFEDCVEVSATFFSRTIPHLADAFDYFLSKGVRTVYFAPVDTHDPGWTLETKDVLDAQFERIYRASLRLLRKNGSVPLVLLRRDDAMENEHAPRGWTMCGAGRGRTLAIDVDGEVSGCAVFARSFQKFPTDFLARSIEQMRIGDVRAPELEHRLAMYPGTAGDVRIFNAKQDKHSSYGTCRECAYLASCSVCPVSIGHIPGNADPDRVPDPLCAFNLIVGKWRARFPAAADPLRTLLGQARLPRSFERVRRAAAATRKKERMSSRQR